MFAEEQYKKPLDNEGGLLVVGDRVESTKWLCDDATYTGTVIGLEGNNLVVVRYDQARSGCTEWRSAAFLWRKIK